MIIPTLGVVLLICFGLSKCQSEDPADAMLRLEGITPGHPSEAKEYARHYTDLGLDKPLFYLGLRPSFCHPNINTIIPKTTRTQLEQFQRQKVHYNDALAYISDRDVLIAKDTSGELKSLAFLTDISEIKDALGSKPNASELIPLMKNLTNSHGKYYFPSIAWHGRQNQFHRYVSSLLTGNLGLSITDGRPVASKITGALKWTLLITFLGLIFTAFIAIMVGSVSGYRAGSRFDRWNNIIWLIFYAIPPFWLASMLIIYCTSDRYGLHIFPSPGNWMVDPTKSFLTQVLSSANMLVLPIICLIANDIAFISRITRNNMIDQSKKLYVTMAKARGLSSRKILTSYVLPNTLIPITTTMIGLIPASISGSLIIEIIFNIPGIGRLMYDAIFHSDWNVVFGVILVISTVTMLIMALGDLLYRWFNPKIATDEE